MDLFARPDTLRKLWLKLINSYALDAIEADSRGVARKDHEGPGHVSQESVRFLGMAAGSRVNVTPSVGLGDHLTLSRPGLTGSVLLYRDKVVQLTVFPIDEKGASNMARPSARVSRI